MGEENKLSLKNFSSKVEDVDEKGIVSIYVNAFNNVDMQGEVSDPKSFNKTISEGIGRVKHLKDHDTTKLLGLPIEMKSDSFGLLVRSALNLQKGIARDVFEDYKFFAEYNRTLEHSVGTQIVKQIADGKFKRNMEYKLWEYSTISFIGANEKTPMVSYKGMGDEYQQLQLFQEMIKKGGYTDERFLNIEKQINLLTKAMKEKIIVTCPSCGFTFDYNGLNERTVDATVTNSVVQYSRWIIEDTVSAEMNKLKPEIQSQVLEMINSTKGINLDGMYNHVRCPKCYAIVTSKSLDNTKPLESTKSDEPKEINLKSITESFTLKK